MLHHLGTNQLTLDWPARQLFPNARVHYQVKARYAKQSREYGYYALKQSGFKIPETAHLFIQFVFPNRRLTDIDNCLAAMKSALDGLADASGVDDKGWSFTLSRAINTEAVSKHIVLSWD